MMNFRIYSSTGAWFITARLLASRYQKSTGPEKRLKVFNEVWEENDFSTPIAVNLTVHNKFYEEGIDTKSNEYATTLINCINNAQGIFNAVLLRNTDEITQYVETI